jgi:hypothetical protein
LLVDHLLGADLAPLSGGHQFNALGEELAVFLCSGPFLHHFKVRLVLLELVAHLAKAFLQALAEIVDAGPGLTNSSSPLMTVSMLTRTTTEEGRLHSARERAPAFMEMSASASARHTMIGEAYRCGMVGLLWMLGWPRKRRSDYPRILVCEPAAGERGKGGVLMDP